MVPFVEVMCNSMVAHDLSVAQPRGCTVRPSAYDACVTRSTRLKCYAATGVVAAIAAWCYGLGPGWTLAAGLLAPALPAFLRGLLRGVATPSASEHPAADKAEMSGTEFEDHVARLARTCGVPVIMTPLSGDWGVDLIVGTRPHRLAIQCKRQGRPVGAGAVQQVVAGAPMQECTRTMVVTNNGFTPAARRLAELHGCVLVGGGDLPRLASTIRGLTVGDQRI